MTRPSAVVPTAPRAGALLALDNTLALPCILRRLVHTLFDLYFESRAELCRRWRVVFYRENASRPNARSGGRSPRPETGMRARDTNARVVCTRWDDPGGEASPRGPC
jgi:hypothetical protein